MFTAIIGAIGGVFSGIGNAIRGYFLKRSVDEVIASVDKNVEKVLPVIEKAVDTAGDVALTAGKVSESVAQVTTNVANVAISDNAANVELHKDETNNGGSFLTRNVRPFIALVSFALVIAGEFHYVPEMEWATTIVLGYMGLRTVDKLGQFFSLSNLFKRK